MKICLVIQTAYIPHTHAFTHYTLHGHTLNSYIVTNCFPWHFYFNYLKKTPHTYSDFYQNTKFFEQNKETTAKIPGALQLPD